MATTLSIGLAVIALGSMTVVCRNSLSIKLIEGGNYEKPSIRVCLPNGCLAFAVSGCNTTKATVDTLVAFTSSTTPGTVFTQDSVLKEEHKAIFFTTLNFENLRQDVAQGHGEYLTSLSALLHIPTHRQEAFFGLAQRHYAGLYAADQTTPSQWLVMLMRDWAIEGRAVQRP
jgi:hypothetical protein